MSVLIVMQFGNIEAILEYIKHGICVVFEYNHLYTRV